MMADELRLLREVFGSSSSDSESEIDESPKVLLPSHQTVADAESSILSSSAATENPNWNWEAIQGINGLWFCKEFLSPLQQSALLYAIACEGWFTGETHNQATKFGDLPSWAIELSNLINDAASATYGYDLVGNEKDIIYNEACVVPSYLLSREPLFDQLIVNVYRPGDLCTC